MSDPRVVLVETPTHGRVLVQRPEGASSGLLLGFHGYAENAAIQMERLREVAGSESWTLASVQALNRFYRGRTEEIVAGWMTRQDRDAAIADNIRYVDTVISAVVPDGSATTIVCAGFSQGVATAFRAGVRGRHRCSAIIAVGGDVPPELLTDQAVSFPPLLIVRGARDEWYTQEKLDADREALETRGVHVEVAVFDGGHEWSAVASAAAGVFLSERTSRRR